MPEFLYLAKNPRGETLSGELEIASREKAIKKLHDLNLTIIRLDPVKPRHWIWYVLEPIKPSLLVLFIRQLAVMLAAGVTLMRTLEVLNAHPGPSRFRKALRRLRTDVGSGYTLSQAMLRSPEFFSPFLIGSVRVGEASGKLVQTLDSCANYVEKEYVYGLKLKNALIYPCVLMTACAALVTFIFKFMIPSFVSLFLDLSMKLPWPTQFLLDSSQFFDHYGRAVLMTGLGPGSVLGYYFLKWARTTPGRYKLERIMLVVPWYGRQVRYRMFARYFRSFATLVASGVKISASLELLARSLDKQILMRAARAQLEAVQRGLSVTQGMKKAAIFPRHTLEMIAVAEEAGKLDDMLHRIANQFDDEMSRGLDTVSKLIEPVVLFILGSVVGFILLAAFLPIYQLASSF
ncbi:MAG: type II secretion system F family protein [Candidatus Xenobia bacterium]